MKADLFWVACYGQRGSTLLNSNLFVYDAGRHAIYLHMPSTGRTKRNLSEPVPKWDLSCPWTKS